MKQIWIGETVLPRRRQTELSNHFREIIFSYPNVEENETVCWHKCFIFSTKNYIFCDTLYSGLTRMVCRNSYVVRISVIIWQNQTADSPLPPRKKGGGGGEQGEYDVGDKTSFWVSWCLVVKTIFHGCHGPGPEALNTDHFPQPWLLCFTGQGESLVFYSAFSLKMTRDFLVRPACPPPPTLHLRHKYYQCQLCSLQTRPGRQYYCITIKGAAYNSAQVA